MNMETRFSCFDVTQESWAQEDGLRRPGGAETCCERSRFSGDRAPEDQIRFLNAELRQARRTIDILKLKAVTPLSFTGIGGFQAMVSPPPRPKKVRPAASVDEIESLKRRLKNEQAKNKELEDKALKYYGRFLDLEDKCHQLQKQTDDLTAQLHKEQAELRLHNTNGPLFLEEWLNQQREDRDELARIAALDVIQTLAYNRGRFRISGQRPGLIQVETGGVAGQFQTLHAALVWLAARMKEACQQKRYA